MAINTAMPSGMDDANPAVSTEPPGVLRCAIQELNELGSLAREIRVGVDKLRRRVLGHDIAEAPDEGLLAGGYGDVPELDDSLGELRDDLCRLRDSVTRLQRL